MANQLLQQHKKQMPRQVHPGMKQATSNAFDKGRTNNTPNSSANASSLMAQLAQGSKPRMDIDTAKGLMPKPIPGGMGLITQPPSNPIIGAPVVSPSGGMQQAMNAFDQGRTNTTPNSSANTSSLMAQLAQGRPPRPVDAINRNVVNPKPSLLPNPVTGQPISATKFSNSSEYSEDDYRTPMYGDTPTYMAPTSPSVPKAPTATPTPNLTPSPVTTNPVVSSMAGPTDNGFANWNSNQSIPDFNGMTPEMIQQIMAGYANGGANGGYYDPAKDPVYNSLLQTANKQADQAGVSTMEDMNERGILNSTVTSDRVGQIKQGASDAVIGSIPGLASNFQNQQANNQAGMQALLESVLGAGQFQQTFGEGNRRFDKGFALDEAATTGRYTSPEAQKAINAVFDAKRIAETKTSTAEQRQQANVAADQGRQLLASLGFDISGLGSNVNLEQAQKNAQYLGRDTIVQQGQDLEETKVMGKQVDTVAQGLIQQVLAAKQANENKTGNRQGNAKVANDARAKLEAMGFDVSGIAGNTSYATALNNASKMGSSTLEAKKLESDNANFDREMTFEEENAKIKADLESRGLDIEDVRNSINLFQAESDAEYKLRQTENDITEQEAKKNTNRAIGEIAGIDSASEGFAFLNANKNSWSSEGVDFKAVIDAIEAKFPGTKAAIENKEEEADSSVGDYFGP